jgi:hypothetical protein
MAETTTASATQPEGGLKQLGGCLWNLVAAGALIFLGINLGEPIVSTFYSNLYGSPQLVNSLRSIVPIEESPLMVCVSPPEPETDNAVALEAPGSAEAATSQVNALSNLRSGPAIDYSVVRVVEKGEPLTVIAYTEKNGIRWYLLRSGEWILGRLVDDPPANLQEITFPDVNAEEEEVRWNGLM